MKRMHYLLMLMMLTAVTSCIEEYNELPEGAQEHMLVIEGQIVSESDCTFTLRYTGSLADDFIQSSLPATGAVVFVESDKGDRYKGAELYDSPGHYLVKVGKLDPEASYYLRVNTEEDSYTSRPMKPLDAPQITELGFEQTRDDRLVDFYVSTADPQEQIFLKWDFVETWEIQTPCKGYWEYLFDDPEAFKRWDPYRDPAGEPSGYYNWVGYTNLKSHGWCTHNSKVLTFTSNDDYGQGAVLHHTIYQRDPDDNRFQTRYLTQVRQMAISAEEYEYLNLMTTQSTEMGGLFTPMPSELPGNVSGANGARAIGYIGVRGRVSEAEIYVNRKEVEHYDRYRFWIVPDEWVSTPGNMIKQGFRVIEHEPLTGKTTWSYRWMVDCTDPYWGASLQRPWYWKDVEADS